MLVNEAYVFIISERAVSWGKSNTGTTVAPDTPAPAPQHPGES